MRAPSCGFVMLRSRIHADELHLIGFTEENVRFCDIKTFIGDFSRHQKGPCNHILYLGKMNIGYYHTNREKGRKNTGDEKIRNCDKEHCISVFAFVTVPVFDLSDSLIM